MTSDLKVLCFIPMKNCQSRIGELIAKLRGPLLSHLAEILVVDNASTDGSLDEARRALSELSGIKVTLLQNSRNYGLGGSHKIAFKHAWENGYDYLFVVHGDNSADPNAFLPVLERGLPGAELVLSDRLHGNFSRKGYPLSRLYFNRLLSTVASLLSFTRIRDFGGGPLNLYRVSSFLNTFENAVKNFRNEIEFSQDALLYGVFRRMKVRFVAIDFVETEAKPGKKLVAQFLKPLAILLKYRLSPRMTIAPDLRGSYFGHTYLKVKVDQSLPVAPPKPRPRDQELEKTRLIDLGRLEKDENEVDLPLVSAPGMQVVWVKMYLRPWHLQGQRLERQIEAFLSEGLPPDRLILDVNADEVVKSKQCYDFLTFCLDRGIEPQLITHAVGDINLWRNYAKLVKNLTINYIPGQVQRAFFFELCKDVAPMGNVSVNVLTHPEYFYHSVGLMKKIQAEVKCRSILLQPYSLGDGQSLPEDHMQVLLDQTAVVHTWFKNNVFRKHVVYTFGQALKDLPRYEQSLRQGFMDMSPRKITKDKVKLFVLEDRLESGSLLT